MSIRTFIFCDVCNPLGIRCPEKRRDVHRDPLIGRRHTDGRAWIEGDSAYAVERGWVDAGAPGAGVLTDRSTRGYIPVAATTGPLSRSRR